MSRREYRKYWHSTTAKNIVLLSADISGYLCPKHTHAGYCVCAVEKGGLRINYENVNIEAFKGDLLFFNPGVTHDGCAWSFKQGCRYRTLEIDKYAMDKIFKDRFGGVTEKYRFGVLFMHMPGEANEFIRLHQKIEELKDETSISEIFDDMQDAIFSRRNIFKIGVEDEDALLEDVRRYLDRNFRRDLKLTDIASEFNISLFYLSREFKRFTGMSLHAYINQKRIHKSLELIKQNRDMADIALEIGFGDQSHFIRVFKSLLGVTPTRYKLGKEQEIHPKIAGF